MFLFLIHLNSKTVLIYLFFQTQFCFKSHVPYPENAEGARVILSSMTGASFEGGWGAIDPQRKRKKERKREKKKKRNKERSEL